MEGRSAFTYESCTEWNLVLSEVDRRWTESPIARVHRRKSLWRMQKLAKSPANQDQAQISSI